MEDPRDVLSGVFYCLLLKLCSSEMVPRAFVAIAILPFVNAVSRCFQRLLREEPRIGRSVLLEHI